MIRLYGETDKVFSNNGDRILQPLYASVHKEDNGDFALTIDLDLSYVDDITEGRIIVCPTPQGAQPFRIHNVSQTRKKISAVCRHVFYDAENYLIVDSYVVDRDAGDALAHLNAATEPTSPFTTISDISVQNSFRCVRKSLYEAVQTVRERWGGHLVRDGWTIGLRETIGQDNGVTVEYAKNLQEITVSYDWSNVVTQLMPEGFDGLMLPEVYLESDIQYEIPYTKCVQFQQNVDREAYLDENGQLDEEAYEEAMIEDLRSQATLYLEENSVPKVNYTLAANLEKITDVGDTVQVNDRRLGLSILTHVIAYDYDPILDKYTKIEFGNFQQTITGFYQSVTARMEQKVEESEEAVKVILGEELTAATAAIWNAMASSYVIYDRDRILVVDRLPKESAQYVIMINSGGIGFSSTGINGTFNSAWTIDGTLDMQQINVINLTANLIRGGTLTLGGTGKGDGILELYNEQNVLIGRMDKEGLKMYGPDGSYVLMNQEVGFEGRDRTGTRIYWVNGDEFHMRKGVMDEEITLCNKLRFIAIERYNGNTMINDGIGLVSVAGV